MIEKWVAFEKQNYINLETFRKNGEGVKTPVWFMRSGDCLYVNTGGSSGKVKRIRRNSRVRIVPSGANGKPLGDWMDATAEITSDLEIIEAAEQLARKKYGFLKKLFEFLGRTNRQKSVTLVIRLV